MASPARKAKRKAEDELRGSENKSTRTEGSQRAFKARYERWGNALELAQNVSTMAQKRPRPGTEIIKNSILKVEDDDFSDDDQGVPLVATMLSHMGPIQHGGQRATGLVYM